MKILFLSRRFYPDIGGVEKHVLEIGKIMVKDEHKVTVITQSPGKEIEYQNIKIIRIPKTPKDASEKLHVWKWFWKNRQLIKDADIIHAHDVYWWYWPYRFIFLSKKSFITFHGYESYPIKKGAIFSKKLSEILANGIIVVGKYIRKWFYTNPDYIIYGAIKPNDNINIESVSRMKNKVKIIFLGRLDDDTGFSIYAEAVKQLEEKVIINFEIFGDGRLKKMAKDVGNFHSFNHNAEMFIRYADIVFSSSYLATMEAFKYKKLVISTYSNPLKKDIIAMTPWSRWICTGKNIEEIKSCVLEYINNPYKYKKQIDFAYNWVINNTWKDLSRIYLKLWKKQ